MTTEKRSTESTDALVDRFIEETWGICDPAPYRQAMSEHFGKAIEWAVAKERQRCIALVGLYVSDREDGYSLKQAIQNG